MNSTKKCKPHVEVIFNIGDLKLGFKQIAKFKHAH